MSLILDALRRSEGGETTSVSIASAEPEALGQPRRGRAVLIVLCCLLLGVSAGWLIRGAGERAQSPTEIAAASQAAPVPEGDSKPSILASANTTSEPTQKEGERRAVASESIPVAATDADVGVLANTVATDPATEIEAKAKQPSVAALNSQMWADADADSPTNPATGQRESAEVAATSKPDVGVEPSPSIAPPIDLAAAIEKAAREVGEPSLVPHPAVLLENLSQQQKDQVPTIVYTAHDFTTEDRSSVTLNQRRLREGERVGSIEVIEILPDSVILKINGVMFRLRALNTWVNL